MQPRMPILRREDLATARPAEHHECGMHAPTPPHAGSLAQARPQRGSDPVAGPWPALRWAGQDRGIRHPDPFEVPLSWAEVMSPIREGAL